jgi:hypothetical protein
MARSFVAVGKPVAVEAVFPAGLTGRDPAPYEGLVWIGDEDGMTCGLEVDITRGSGELLERLADRMSEFYVDLYRVGLPLVPGTQRPARASLRGGIAVWEDPADAGSWYCPVGQYPGQ